MRRTVTETDWLGISSTEGINPATTEIDTSSSSGIVAAIAAEDAKVAPAVAVEGKVIAHLASVVAERMRRGGRLIYAGAGTSGRLGVLDASEIPPTFGLDPRRVIGIIAGGPCALTTSIEAVEDGTDAGERDIAGLDVGWMMLYWASRRVAVRPTCWA